MKRGRGTEEQIIGILKEHQAGLSAQHLCRKHGIRDATFYNLRKCIRPLASGPLLRPGHDEMRTRRFH